MLDQLRRRVTYANVMSTIAVFGVLAGGGAYAASKIGPKDIGANAIRAKHIKGNQVVAKHVRSRAIKPRHLATRAVTFRAPACPTDNFGRVVALGGLVVECSYNVGLNVIEARGRTTVNDASIQSPTATDFDFDVGENFGVNPRPAGSPVVYSNPNGSVVSLSLALRGGGFNQLGRVVGTAIGG